ncbi:MAG: LysE family translocator [Pseudomonadota bacterium]
MPEWELIIAFLAATAVFAYMPGPATLYAAAQTIARGRDAGLLAALGLHTGGYVHVLAAAFGLAALFTAIPVLYTILKFVGAAYLIWLGVSFLLQSRHSMEMPDGTSDLTANAPSTRRAFWESVTVEVLNPKTALFYLAFLPQFTDPAAAMPLWLQLLTLGTVVNVMFSTADLFCVFLAERVATRMRNSPAISRWTGRIGGGILIALAVNLLTSR